MGLRAVEVKFGKLGTTWRHWLNGQALISDAVVSSSVGRALAMKAGDPGSSPGRTKKLFGPRVLAHPCNPATWRSRSVTRRMSCLGHRLVSKSCLIITPPAALPPKYCVGSEGENSLGQGGSHLTTTAQWDSMIRGDESQNTVESSCPC